MIQSLNKVRLLDLVYFLKNNHSTDFYITENNIRKYPSSKKEIKRLLKISKYGYFSEEKDETNGIILVWESIGNNIKRYYVKINAPDKKIANNLLIVLLWNCNKQLYVKLKNTSKLVNIFKDKKFNFCGIRGSKADEILLNRNVFVKETQNGQYEKKE